MTPVKLIYRAQFLRPIGALNPSGFKVPTPVEVELRKVGSNWRAFRPESKTEFQEITPQPSAATLQGQMKLYFQSQTTEWEIFMTEPAAPPYIRCKPVTKDRIATDLKGRTFLREPTEPEKGKA